MKVVDSFWVKYTPKPVFLVKCPYCGEFNEEKYWIRYLICEKCGKVSSLTPEAMNRMVEAIKKYEEELIWL